MNHQTNDWLEPELDKLLIDILDYVKRMEKAKSPILFLGKYKKLAMKAILDHIAANYVPRGDLEGEYMRGCADQSRVDEAQLQERVAAERTQQALVTSTELIKELLKLSKQQGSVLHHQLSDMLAALTQQGEKKV